MVMDKRPLWIVCRYIPMPERTCGHNASAVLAICEDCPDKSAEEMARDFCLDETYFIGPWAPNVLVPDYPVVGWPGCYCPYFPHRQQTRES